MSGMCVCAKLPLVDMLPGRSLQMRWAGTCWPLTDTGWGGYVHSGHELVNAVTLMQRNHRAECPLSVRLGREFSSLVLALIHVAMEAATFSFQDWCFP